MIGCLLDVVREVLASIKRGDVEKHWHSYSNRMKCTEGKWINRNCDTFIKKVKGMGGAYRCLFLTKYKALPLEKLHI